MIDETRARFLASIAAQIPVERVAEVHLFPAIRQGGMESGVAVLALTLAKEPAPESEPSAADADAAEASAAQQAGESEARVAPAPTDDADGGDGPYAEEQADDSAELEEFDDLDGRATSSESYASEMDDA